MRWRSFFKGKRHKAESDVEPDPNTASPAPGGTHVGRVSGSDPGYVDETGAERRAGAGDAGANSPDADAH